MFFFLYTGTDPFHTTTPPTYVPQQPQTQPGSQGPLRTIAPAGPPNQPTTPPNNELKVQQMQQQPSMNIVSIIFFCVLFVVYEDLKRYIQVMNTEDLLMLINFLEDVYKQFYYSW